MANNKRNLVEVKRRDSQHINFTDEEIKYIRRTIASEATEDEFRMFIHVAKSYGLDPFNKEIFFWKEDDQGITMTSRDGYLRIADRHPQYNGIVSDVVKKGDKFKRTIDGIEHQYGTDRGDIIGAYALVYRRDRKYPVYVFAPFDEYNAHTKIWLTYKTAMILKVAESMALKRAFTVSGLVSREEMDSVQTSINHSQPQKKSSDESFNVENNSADEKEPSQQLSVREVEIKDIISDNQELKRDLYSYLSYAKQENGMSDSRIGIDDLTDKQYQELKEILLRFRKVEDRKQQSA